MSEGPDWWVWLLAAGVLALFVWYFWFVAGMSWRYGRRLIDTIQNWPQIRRAMVEAEARAGGRYPLWYRAIRVLLVLGMIALVGYIGWRRFG